jgi:hypothetical protein
LRRLGVLVCSSAGVHGRDSRGCSSCPRGSGGRRRDGLGHGAGGGGERRPPASPSRSSPCRSTTSRRACAVLWATSCASRQSTLRPLSLEPYDSGSLSTSTRRRSRRFCTGATLLLNAHVSADAMLVSPPTKTRRGTCRQ